jgi:hypothetical protein
MMKPDAVTQLDEALAEMLAEAKCSGWSLDDSLVHFEQRRERNSD